MFDIGFSEMIVIAIVALVVIGPERLPKVARTAGHLLGRLQRYVSDVKADINREMQIEELKRLQAEVQESARSVEQSVTSQLQAVQQSAQVARDAVLGSPPPADASSPAVQPPAIPDSASSSADPATLPRASEPTHRGP